MYKKLLIIISCILSVILLASCSHTDSKTVNDLALRAETGIKEAEVLNADKYAPVELRSARMKLEDARNKLANNQYQQAEWMLEKAMVDAEYARVKTRSEKAQESASQIQKNIQTLESQL